MREVCSVEGLLSEGELKRVLIHSHCKEISSFPFSQMARKIDLSAKRICIERGPVSSSPSWYYNDPKDAICVSVSKNVMLDGFGIFGGTGTVTAMAKVYLGDNDRDESRCGECVGEAEGSWQQTTANATPHELKFKKRVKLKKGVKYTLELHQRTTGGDQAYRVSGAGAFPCLWMYRRD